MIYFLNKPVDWSNPKTDIEKTVAKGIAEVREKYFGEDKPNVIKLVDERGKQILNKSGYYEPAKIFPLELVGGEQGEYRYTASMPRLDDKGNPQFGDSRKHVKHILELQEKDLELAYFLLKHNQQVVKGRIKLMDDEADALAIVKKEANDLDLKYYIYSSNSPIANSAEVFKSIAITFGIAGVNALGVNQLKNRIYEVVSLGNKNQNRFVNTDTFMKLITSDEMREVARIVYNAVEMKDLVYSTKDFAWHFSSGGDLGESILNVPGKDQANAIQLLINGCVNKPELRKAVFGFLGKINYKLDGLRSKSIIALREEVDKRVATLKGDSEGEKEMRKSLKYNSNVPKEGIIEILCKFDGIDYEPTPL